MCSSIFSPATRVIVKKNKSPFSPVLGFPEDPVVKNSPGNAGDAGSIPELGRFPGEGNGNPLQYSGLENPMDRGAWRATVHGVARVGHNLATKPAPLNQGFEHLGSSGNTS